MSNYNHYVIENCIIETKLINNIIHIEITKDGKKYTTQLVQVDYSKIKITNNRLEAAQSLCESLYNFINDCFSNKQNYDVSFISNSSQIIDLMFSFKYKYLEFNYNILLSA